MDYKDKRDIKIKTTKDQQQCADFSASIPEGNFWTWHKRNKKCYVKKAKGHLVHVRHVVSGNRGCGRKTSDVDNISRPKKINDD